LQIGRKIYYEKATGNVIFDKGEMQGDVIDTTIDQDFESFTVLSKRTKDSVGLIQLTYGENKENIGKYPYHIDVTQNPPMIVWDTAVPAGVELAGVQDAKIAQLTDLYEKATSTFTSSALGTVRTYLADDKSIGKFNAEYSYVNGPSYDGKDIKWYTVEEGGVLHNKDQFNQAWLDGRNYLAQMFEKWDSLTKQVKAAKTVDQVNSITW
jgi:hypothetical protein